jgi:hypothetical protein
VHHDGVLRGGKDLKRRRVHHYLVLLGAGRVRAEEDEVVVHAPALHVLPAPQSAVVVHSSGWGGALPGDAHRPV